MDELQSMFRFNDAVIREMVLSRPEAVTEPSPLAKSNEDRDERPARGERERDSSGRSERSEASADA
jgi:small subunit ribosomal protein S6